MKIRFKLNIQAKCDYCVVHFKLTYYRLSIHVPTYTMLIKFSTIWKVDYPRMQ